MKISITIIGNFELDGKIPPIDWLKNNIESTINDSLPTLFF